MNYYVLLVLFYRAVTDSINYLVDVCTSAAPGQKECDNALRNIQAMRPLLDNPSEPVSEATYFECLDSVMEKSKSLGKKNRKYSNFLHVHLLQKYLNLL
jgi:talin